MSRLHQVQVSEQPGRQIRWQPIPNRQEDYGPLDGRPMRGKLRPERFAELLLALPAATGQGIFVGGRHTQPPTVVLAAWVAARLLGQ